MQALVIVSRYLGQYMYLVLLLCEYTSNLGTLTLHFCRYVVGSNRVLFLLSDGSKAWEIKDYLLEQERCELVTIEGKDYFGNAHPEVSKI